MRLGAKMHRAIASVFHIQPQSATVDYASWRRNFMRSRLKLGLWLALISFLTFTLLELSNLIFNREAFQVTWLRSQIAVEFSLALCLLLMHSRLGHRRPGLILLGFSWSVMLIPLHVRAVLTQALEPDLIVWPLALFGQATLVPVCWSLHLISQLGLVGYFVGLSLVRGFPIQMSAVWLTPAVLTLYLLWIFTICNLSVYLYERVQQAEFKARRQLEQAYDKLAAEQQRSEQLLLNILPSSIAERLKYEPTTIADSFAEVSVLFADIVGFTALSDRISPPELVQLLNQIFSRFDQLAEQHQLEKIKTIGDAYMVVSGLPEPKSDHADAIASMALDMQASLDEFNAQMQQDFRIRIGIATGPVIAGVIGIKKFIYDLWGDTVNMASRMESQGIAGRIQVTEATYNRLKSKYIFESRGAIQIKGKGAMLTYLLVGKKG
ncbi:MAG: adenylate/guanylate cyclase domain-containing protein [Cyanobacteria bacterium FC1]|uniref:adenylate/guanylate cyclase domain-containing protein n=1 Tax=Desertifilum tharense TaxID=1185873 RepID=UPI003F813590|nr:adenylate/guanylate cyclase domain-containing protein [Cyanobacteria bacterium FC1]